MCSHGYFYQENKKQTRTTVKNINLVLLRMSHSLKVPYTSRISYRVLNLVFSRGRGGGKGRLFHILSLRKCANSKRGAYLKFGAISSIYGIFTRDDEVSQRLKFGSVFLSSSWESKISLCFLSFPYPEPVRKNCVIFIGCNFESRASQVGLQKQKNDTRQQTVVSKEGKSKLTA